MAMEDRDAPAPRMTKAQLLAKVKEMKERGMTKAKKAELMAAIKMLPELARRRREQMKSAALGIEDIRAREPAEVMDVDVPEPKKRTRAEIMAMARARKAAKAAPAPAKAPTMIERIKNLPPELQNIIRKMAKPSYDKMVDDIVDKREEPRDDMDFGEAIEYYMDPLLKALGEGKGKFVSFGGSDYGGSGSALELVVAIVREVLKTIDVRNAVKIEQFNILPDDNQFRFVRGKKVPVEVAEQRYADFMMARLPPRMGEREEAPEFGIGIQTIVSKPTGDKEKAAEYMQMLVKPMKAVREAMNRVQFSD
jgi:hypothetical protein